MRCNRRAEPRNRARKSFTCPDRGLPESIVVVIDERSLFRSHPSPHKHEPPRMHQLANQWPIFYRTPERTRVSSELPARKPASPDTCVLLLTGGLLVRIQPEEPT